MIRMVAFPGLMVVLMLLTGCATQAGQPPDPLEGFNRAVFAFNDTADRWVVKPVAKGYTKVLPSPARTGIGNFFDNVTYPLVVVNQLLQGKFRDGASDMLRFAMNTTAGIGGLFDVASMAGLRMHEEDFGQTFARWGFGPGPFLMLPFLGPSTVREGTGSIISYAVSPIRFITDDDTTRYSLTALNLIQTRASLLDAEQLISGDRYSFIRDAYLQRRDYLNKDGQVEDDFLDDDWEE
jgi:phospholipid-binding lipoprotein MlaA